MSFPFLLHFQETMSSKRKFLFSLLPYISSKYLMVIKKGCCWFFTNNSWSLWEFIDLWLWWRSCLFWNLKCETDRAKHKILGSCNTTLCTGHEHLIYGYDHGTCHIEATILWGLLRRRKQQECKHTKKMIFWHSLTIKCIKINIGTHSTF